MRRYLLLVITLSAFVILCDRSALAKDKWTKTQTRNFRIVGNANEGDMRKMAIRLVAFC